MCLVRLELSRLSVRFRTTGLQTPYATPAAWRGIRGSLERSFRFFSTSLPGYGTTPEVRPECDPDIDVLIEFVGEVVEAVSEPVHVVGHSWGAQLALAAVLKERISPLSLICFEANPIFARPAGGSFPWSPDVSSMVDDFEAALVTGDPEAAAIIIDFYSRPGTFLAMPDPVRAFCQATAPTNLRDWRSAATFAPNFEEFSDLDLPVTLVRGSATPTPIVDVTEQLATHIPGARKKVVESADHFLISTHSSECAKILEAHFAEIGG
jgi:pimeloyl-ACP methyl ester carboxylesterase